MKPENFTAERVARFRCEPGKHQTLFWDRKTPGLGLRVTANGAKSYIFEARLQGRTLRWTIGDVRTWAIGKAQEEATRLKTLTDQGLDPRELRAQELVKADAARAEAKRKSTLVREAWDAYLAHHQKRWGARHLADHHALAQTGGQPKKRGKGVTVDGVLRPLLDMCLGEITADVLRSWQAKEAANRANNARQRFELFRPFWRWCASQPDYAGAVDKQTVEDKDLLAEVPSRKTKRFDVLERAQLSAWFAAVRGLDNASASAYLQALLLTGARREEMAALMWADVDFRWGSLWVKDKVVEEGRKIPLTPYVSSLLAALPRRNEWVFSSPTAKAGRIAEPRIPHNRALSVAGLNHVTLHGLRRSFSSLAEWVEMPTGVVAQIMGHAPNATAEKHYINRPLELLAVWHGKYEAWILEQADIQFGRVQNRINADIESAPPGALRLVGAS
jgi:integrase